MADDARKIGEPDVRIADAELSARLQKLGQRLDQVGPAKTAGASGSSGRADGSGMARGLRLSAELVGGVVVGSGLGLGFDALVGTKPWGFVVFLMLGFAGGVLSVMRSAGVIPPNKR